MTELRPAEDVADDVWHAESTINGDGAPLIEADRREAQAALVRDICREIERFGAGGSERDKLALDLADPTEDFGRVADHIEEMFTPDK